MGKWMAAAICLLLVAGCGNRGADMQSGREIVDYPELDEFDNGEHFLALGYMAEGRGGRPDWNGVRQAAAAEPFQAALAKLEASQPPSGIPLEKKDAVVSAAKKLSEGSSNEETQAAYQELLDSIREIRKLQ